jgi:hypothetical protein
MWSVVDLGSVTSFSDVNANRRHDIEVEEEMRFPSPTRVPLGAERGGL